MCVCVCEKSGMVLMNGNIKDQRELTKEQMVEQLSVSVLVMIMKLVVTLLYVPKNFHYFIIIQYLSLCILPGSLRGGRCSRERTQEP